MKRDSAKVGLTLLCSLTVLVACSSTSHAQQGVIPSVYNFIFGGPNRTVTAYPPAPSPSVCAPQPAFRPNPCNPCAGSNAVGYRAYRPQFSLLPPLPLFNGYYNGRTAYYGGPATYYNGTTTYYGGTTTYRPQSESPDCAVPQGASEPTPAPGADEPQTFADGEEEVRKESTGDSYEQDSGGDAGFRSRKSTPDNKDSQSDSSGLEHEGFKPPLEGTSKPNDTQRRPSPGSGSGTDSSGSNSGDGGTENPDAAGTLQIPAIDRDDKVTWDAAPQHRRQFIRAAFEAPRVVRRSVDRDAEWTPAPVQRHVVSK